MSGGVPDDERDGRRRRGLRRRAALVEAVLAVVARDGLAGVTHGTIAAEAGLPRSAVSHHFASLDELLAAALRSGTEQLIADVAQVPRSSGPEWFAVELVRLFDGNRARVAAAYELYTLAARRPALRDAVALWLGLLADLAAHHTDDPRRTRAFAAAVDGYFLQCLATGTSPRVGRLQELLDLALRASETSPDTTSPASAAAPTPATTPSIPAPPTPPGDRQVPATVRTHLTAVTPKRVG